MLYSNSKISYTSFLYFTKEYSTYPTSRWNFGVGMVKAVIESLNVHYHKLSFK